jgi:LDH2 family malate/lactate/ureidoglycolate dehydrogenase
MAQTAQARVYLGAKAARDFAARLFVPRGVPEDDARVIAKCLVRADLRGVETHGLTRMGIYLDRLARGLVDPAPQLEPQRLTPSVALLDGRNGFGFVTATRAMAQSVAMAEECGIGLTAVRRSTHFGMAACYLLQAVEAGYGALVFTNASPAMPPWGGREPLLGTSPFGAGLPGGGHGAFVLDMAPSVAARGKIRRALKEGKSIPEGYALDAEGRPTTDPAAALAGVVLPIGGPKGSGLSMLMDILGGVLTGAAFAGAVGDQYKVFDRPQNVGHVLIAFRPDLFVGRDEFLQRMDALVERVKANPLADGFDEILIPGEMEARKEEERLRTGIPYLADDLEPLLAEAKAAGIEPPPVAAQPLG